jgi:hypothetical protein
MNPHRLFLALSVAFVLPRLATALEPAPLEKDDAVRTLLSMGYDRVKVVAIVDGVHQKKVASMSCATVVGLGRRNGCDEEIVQSFFYDRDLGWFYFETVEGRMRIWNRDGFQEFTSP